MAASEIAAAMHRVESVLRRRPQQAIADDSPATAHWAQGLRVATRHANGVEVLTDMPRELGGSGDQVSPGWLLRAALASCAVTRIAMAAAAEGIDLRTLDAQALSRSDARGMLGIAESDGTRVSAAPGDVQLQVRISASGIESERLRALVRRSCDFAPVTCAMQDAVAVALHIEVEAA